MIRYTILSIENAPRYWQSYCEVVSTLVASKGISYEIFLQTLQKMIHQGSHVHLAIDTDHDRVVGAVTLLVEHKLTKGGCKAGHMEEIVVSEDFQSQGIGKALVQKIIEHAQHLGCYKILGDTRHDLLPRFEKYGFISKEICVKKYL